MIVLLSDILSKFRYVIIAVFIFVVVLVVSCYQRDRSGGGNVPPDEYIQQAIAEFETKAATHAAKWGLGQEIGWAVNQDTGIVSFTFADGTVANAPAQIVGTYNVQDKTFLWAWAHPKVQKSCCDHAELALQFGKKNELSLFTSSLVTCTKDDAGMGTMVAAKLGKAQGVYRGQDGGTILFMTFGEVSLSNP